jgi:hypothetical protein
MMPLSCLGREDLLADYIFSMAELPQRFNTAQYIQDRLDLTLTTAQLSYPYPKSAILIWKPGSQVGIE